MEIIRHFLGCPLCFRDRKKPLLGQKTAEDLYAQTQIRKMELERRGYRVAEIWQCKWMEMLKSNDKIMNMWKKIDLPPGPLHPRINALRGGRVEPFRLYGECASLDEHIEHYDIVCFIRSSNQKLTIYFL